MSMLAGCQTVSDGYIYEEINPIVTHQCDNDVAVRCYGSACTADVNDDYERVFTHFDEDGNLKACVKSGCWEGRADVSSINGFMVLTGMHIAFTAHDPSQSKKENIAIVLDNSDYVAILKVGEFSQPLFCN